jgi:chemotaxis protein methyltransferase CheR
MIVRGFIMQTEPMSLDLTQAQFEEISDLIYRLCGLNLHTGKEVLVKARLAKRLRALSFKSFNEYVRYIENDKSGRELSIMVDSLTTNKTSFFRESQHFEFLRTTLVPKWLARGGKIRIWSAGCSTGEEPYTLAIVLSESIPRIDRVDVRILATDISTRVLESAKRGVYSEETLRDVPAGLVQKYFDCTRSKPTVYEVKPELKSMIRFARLNLMEEWPMHGPFDAVFCRNVMIYFDKPTQQNLIQRYWSILAPDGHMFVGHSESLTATSHDFRYVQPAVYVK